MSAALLFKIAIGTILLLILGSLVSGMFFLIRDQGRTTRTAKSLTLRIVLSIALFILLFIGLSEGWIQPHGIGK